MHSRSRMAVETAFGWLKMRFSCLRNVIDRYGLHVSTSVIVMFFSSNAFGFLSKHTTNTSMIVACMVLHNILIDLNDNPHIEDDFEQHTLFDEASDVVENDNEAGDMERQMGRLRRDKYAQHFYTKARSLKRQSQ